ncbi:MAG TPA: lipid-A-disaccharide synthase [Chthoniobacterales bacterium]|nr:lipid-A-disaccharide synthase [Chthoniobacterales bacterium]
MKTIYFVAGEASADNHGAALMRALRNSASDIRFVGRGGPQMKSVAGGDFKDWINQSGVLGLWEVIKHYGYFRKQFHEALREIETNKPTAVVLIDYPGFNLRLARALRRKIPAQKIIYYISPQVWAWNRGRIKKMARWLDLMLCIFPFEADLYNPSGLRTIFVGHPMLERLHEHKVDVARNPNLIGLFPGSREREVRKILPVLVETARELRRLKPNLRFQIAAASNELAQKMEKMIDAQDRQILEIKTGQTAEIMQRAFAGIVASGSATLEAAYFRMPFALIYKVAWPTYFAGRLLVKVKYLGMPNVLADKEVAPEFIQHRARPVEIVAAIARLIDDAQSRQQQVLEFDKIAAQLGETGASERAAKAILAELSSPATK